MNAPKYRTTFGFVLGLLALIIVSWVAMLELTRARW